MFEFTLALTTLWQGVQMIPRGVISLVGELVDITPFPFNFMVIPAAIGIGVYGAFFLGIRLFFRLTGKTLYRRKFGRGEATVRFASPLFGVSFTPRDRKVHRLLEEANKLDLIHTYIRNLPLEHHHQFLTDLPISLGRSHDALARENPDDPLVIYGQDGNPVSGAEYGVRVMHSVMVSFWRTLTPHQKKDNIAVFSQEIGLQKEDAIEAMNSR
jgi:hypothetical protein